MYWKESLKIQCDSIIQMLNNQQLEKEANELIKLIKNTNEFVYFTGIGKNGFVAAKVASTFNSLGIRSLFIDPVNTLHGDMNIFTDKDILIAISKSGETEELIHFISTLKKTSDTKVISIVSKQDSSLEKLSTLTVHIPILHEGDHLNLAPVASSVVFMSFLQSLAVQISSENGFDKKQFVKGHPGGTLGKTKV
jgi:arabinose-5-phosphate isomerase